MKFSYTILAIFFSSILFSTNISGVVKDVNGIPIERVRVSVSKGNNILKETLTDKKGEFNLKLNFKEDVLVTFSGNSVVKSSKKIKIKSNVFLSITLKYKELQYKIDAVNITSYKKSTQLKKSPLSISSLDTKKLVKKANNSSDLISEISGVNIRKSAGLGSSIEFSINGVSGKQIRLFLDGIPIELYGTNLNIGVFSPNFLKRIDIYKGVIPIELSADALGGVINLISDNSKKKVLNINYNIGSFNTHRFSFNSFQEINKNVYFNLNTFYNHSDNNYRMKNAEVIDKKGKISKQSVNRFHNKFDNWFVKGKIGLKKQSWADEFFLAFYGTGTKYEIQNNRFGDQVFGKVSSSNLSLGTLIKYQKKDIFKKMSVDFFMVYKNSNPNFNDLSKDLYNWKGEILFTKEEPSIGEMSSLGINRSVTDRSLAGQLSLSWKINDSFIIKTTYQKSQSHRRGKDIIAENNQLDNLLKNPTKYDKSILGLSIETKLFNEKLSAITFLKNYQFKYNNYAREHFYYGKISPVFGKQNELGYGQALSYQQNDNSIFKCSYEYTFRLPSPQEIYGNLGGIIPNANLKSEESHNLNFGIVHKKNKLNTEINLFFRNPKNLIYLQTSKFLSQYQNIAQSRILGIDSEFSYKLFNNLRTTLNFTWQDIRNQTLVGKSSKYVNERLPNRPFFFGNFNVNYHKNKIFNTTNDLKFWYSIRYVKEFFLSWESEGKKRLKNVIPNQFPNQTGISFISKKNNYSISIECQNIFDQLTYDRFKLQKAGRSFYITLNYKR